MEGDKKFIVKSGDGYFLRFILGTGPEMTSDPAEASRHSEVEAENTTRNLERLGFAWELIEVDE